MNLGSFAIANAPREQLVAPLPGATPGVEEVGSKTSLNEETTKLDGHSNKAATPAMRIISMCVCVYIYVYIYTYVTKKNGEMP